MNEDILYVKHVMIYRRGRKRTLVIEEKKVFDEERCK